MRLPSFLLLGLLISGLSGCSTLPGVGLLSKLSFLSPYKMDIRQGNYISTTAVDKLQPGMTRDQVQFIMGTPLIADIFHADRWDYIYSLQHDGKQVDFRRVTLYFDQGKLARIEKEMGTSPASAAANVAKSS